MRRLLLLSLLVSTACFSSEEKTESAIELATGTKIDIDDKTVTIRGPDGEKVTTKIDTGEDGTTTLTNDKGARTTIGQGKVPPGFPLPIFEGAEVSMGMSSEQGGQKAFSLTFQSSAKAEEIGAFYEKALKEKGLKVRKVAHAFTGQPMVMISGVKGKKKAQTNASINITGEGEAGQSVVVISWTEST